MRRIKRILFERGITQREIADKAGIDRAAMSELVNGKRFPYHGWAVRIAEAMGWKGDPEDLFAEVR